MHQVTVGQEPPLGLPVVTRPVFATTLHALPFQSSTMPLPFSVSLPTPMQVVAAAQETPDSEY